MNPEERIWELLSKKEGGEITGDELTELEKLLRDNETIAGSNAILGEIWQHEMIAAEQSFDTRRSWDGISDQLHQQQTRRTKTVSLMLKWAAAAAVILMIAGAARMYLSGNSPRQPSVIAESKPNQVSTAPGSRSKLVLPDGTKVWLNAGSRITYADFNGAATREVSLWGEAFFEVVHSDIQPFIVHTPDADIRDLGTSFGIKAYPGDDHFETTLIEGSVEVTDHRQAERKILLKPREKLTISFKDSTRAGEKDSTRQGGLTMLYKIDKIENDAHGLLPETAWTQNKLVFNNEPFERLAERMERWYNVSIHFEGQAIARTPFSGIIENETLEQALQAMQFSTPFKYKINEADVWITQK